MFAATVEYAHRRPAMCLVTALCCAASALAADPDLRSVTPVAVARDSETTLHLRGVRLADAAELLRAQPGLAVVALDAKNHQHVEAKLRVAADAPLGEHQLRVRTASGVSQLATVHVTALPIIDEAEDNNQLDQAQAIELGTAVRGVVKNEDVDYFRVEAKAGTRITAEIAAMRLGGAVFDPAVAILDAERFELAVSDDAVLLLQDSLASVIAPADGSYYIRVREASYGGGDAARYVLQVGQFPRPTVPHPVGTRPGAATQLELRGDVAGPIQQEYTPSASSAGRVPVFACDERGTSPSPVWLWVSDLPQAIEPQTEDAEPLGELEPPSAIDGVIAAEGEVDRFMFRGRQGVALEIEAIARQVRSPIDAVISVHEAGGKWLAVNDDSGRPDSKLRFTPPADGRYQLRVRDHLRRGGATFVYRVELRPIAAGLEIAPVVYDRRSPQERQAIAVPQGNRFAALWEVNRRDVGGPVNVSVADLPPGVRVLTTTVPNGINRVPVVFEADADAAPGATLAAITGVLQRDHGDDLIGRFEHHIPLVLGPPNQTTYYATHAERLPVAVTEAAPFRIRVTQPAAPLVRKGSKQLQVSIERDAGFDGIVDLHRIWLPPGVGAAGRVRVEKDATTAEYPFNANGSARTGVWPVVVIARANVGGNVWVAANPIALTVAEPLIDGRLQLAAVERGQPVAFVCEITSELSFAGEGEVRLIGVPPHVKHAPQPITAETKQLVFNLAVTDQAPVGKHRGLRCELRLPQGDETIVQQFAHGGVLRIDKPRQPVAQKGTPKAKPQDKPAEPKTEPLSRLEQLRQAARAAREAGSTQ